MAEYWDLYDGERNRLEGLHLRGEPMPKGTYHLIVEVWVLNSRDELLLSKRHPDKRRGGYWECTGGAVIAGESTREGAARELAEEVGLSVTPEELLFLGSSSYSGTAVSSACHLDIYLARRDASLSDLRLQPDEVVDAKWVARTEYDTMRRRGEIVPDLPDFWELLHCK